jgi:hypothetical protein
MAMRMGFSSLVYHEEVTVTCELLNSGSVSIRRLTQGDTREEWSFGKTNEESAYGKTSTAGHSRHADSADTPSHHHSGEKPSGVCLCKPQISGQLTQKIADVKGTDACVPDSVRHVQVLLQPCKTGVGHIDAIKIAKLDEREAIRNRCGECLTS